MLSLQHGTKPEIYITQADQKRLRNLAVSAALSIPEVSDELLDELDRAITVTEEDEKNFIRIGSIATYKAGEREKTVRLVLPLDADINQGKISILTPVGVALLGLSEGQSIDWSARDGRIATLTVLKIHARGESL